MKNLLSWLSALTLCLALISCVGDDDTTSSDSGASGSPSSGSSALVLLSVSVSGAERVDESSSSLYQAMAHYDDGTSRVITPEWAESCSFSTIANDGTLSTDAVDSDRLVIISATFEGVTGSKEAIITNIATLTAITIDGAATVAEDSTGIYSATAHYDDNTTAIITPTWVEDSSYASITANGTLTVLEVPGDQGVSITATYQGLSASKDVTIVNIEATLLFITISGVDTVTESSNASYNATAHYDDATTVGITPVWSEDSAYASIASNGIMATSSVSSNESVTITATYQGLDDTLIVTITDVPVLLTSITINGGATIGENSSASYSATAHYDNNTTAEITPSWHEDSAYASIANDGTLTTSGVNGNSTVTLTASFDGVSGTKDVTIVDVSQGSSLYIADQTIAKESVLRRIPESALTAARDNLHILYCGTSHSSQVMSGMAGLEQYKAGDATRFAFTHGSTPVAGKLDIHYRGVGGDLSGDGLDGDGHTAYFRGTVTYLDSHSDVNVVMWSWCSIEGHYSDRYLNNFDELVEMYRAGGSKGRTAANAVTFVWMTGYARGSHGDEAGAARSPYNNHKDIVEHCQANGYFCLDYWSQDVYDYGTDFYKPYESGNANVQHYEYVQSHNEGVDWFPCRSWTNGGITYPAHTNDNSTYAQHLTGNRRAYAAWWIWARIAGWDGILE